MHDDDIDKLHDQQDGDDGGEGGGSGLPIFEVRDKEGHLNAITQRKHQDIDIQQELAKDLQKFGEVAAAKETILEDFTEEQSNQAEAGNGSGFGYDGYGAGSDLPAHPLISNAAQFAGMNQDQTQDARANVNVQAELQQRLQNKLQLGNNNTPRPLI